jgi:hypothetical protein
MNNPYASQYQKKSNTPRFLSLIIGFASSFILGILFGLSASVFYSLVGQKGGLEFLTFPLAAIVLAGTAAICFFVTRFIDKKIKRS